MGLKHIILVLALSGCTTYHINKHKGLDFDQVGKAIYFKGEKAAELKAIELSYDDCKLVYEATFVLTSSKYNDYAIEIIKVARKQKAMKDWDIEVELQY